MPKISVVMPVYNGEKYLCETMDSILNQTFADFEFIIINDASKDSTEEIIRSYEDDRIVYLKNEQNLGVAGTLNRGLEVAKGEYIARIDADDIAMPERFEKQVAFMDAHPEVGVCGSRVNFLYEDYEEEGYTVFGPEYIKIDMLFASCLAHPAVMIRNSVLRENQFKYDEYFEKVEDYELWSRISKKCSIDNVPETLLKYRIHDGQITQTYGDVQLGKLIELKRRFLDEMDIEYTEQEVRVLADVNRMTSRSDFEIVKQLLKKIYNANQMVKIYNNRILKTYFRNIMFKLYLIQEKTERKEISLKCDFVSDKDIFLFKIKNIIKQFIKIKR